MVGLASYNIIPMVYIVWVIVWDPNKAIDIKDWSVCGGSRLEYNTFVICIYHYISHYIFIYISVGIYIYIIYIAYLGG